MNRETIRIVVTASFLFTLLVIYQQWEKFSKAGVTDQSATSSSQISEQPNTDELPSQSQLLETPDDPPTAVTLDSESSERIKLVALTSLENDLVKVQIEQNGTIIETDLLKHLDELDGNPLALLHNSDTASGRYHAQSGLLGDGLPSHKDSGWQAVAATSLSVVSSWQNESVAIERTIVLAPQDYLVTLSYKITNKGSRTIEPQVYFQLVRDVEPPSNYSSLLPSFYGAVTFTEANTYEKFDFDDLEDYPKKTNDGWIGIVQRYFLVAWLDSGSQRENYMRNLPSGEVAIGLIRTLGRIEPGATATIQQPLFAGALEQEMLGKISPEIGERLNLTVDYGFLTVLCVPLFWLLSKIESVVGNWGIAIILLTLAIKTLFYPLASASYRSMAKMKKFSPKIKELKDRLGSDREGFQKAMMGLYRKEKINPLGGCLPILVQIPVFIALYWVILGSVELRHAPLVFWIADLSSPDRFYVMPVLLGLIMFLQTKLNPTPPDPTQALILKIMPLGFAAFSIFFPAGLVLYWLTNTLLSIMQQWLVTREVIETGKRKK